MAREIQNDSLFCTWMYWPGPVSSHYATVCNGENYYLPDADGNPLGVGAADCYNGRVCPVCKKRIKVDYRLVM